MEQLGRPEIDGLVRRARGLAATLPSDGALWARRASPSTAVPDGPGHVDADPGGLAGACPTADESLPMANPERRLARRAESLWEALRGGHPLPPASAAAVLLAPPFSGHGLLVAVPAPGKRGDAPRILQVGHDVQKLGISSSGARQSGAMPSAAPGGAPAALLGGRLVALAVQASAEATTMAFDSEAHPFSVGGSQPPLLMRAIALPLAPEAGCEALVVVITSWRELLSAGDTASLHRELAAAIGWMHSHRSPC